ncbi:MAG: HAMP domain-containing protein [Proteobacteria bacterium]|nr:MAG: HAMP domain-containing protein [Pseudomonadota bacterium]
MEIKFYPKKQRLVLINRDFQFRYTGAAVLVGLLSTMLTTTLILYPLYTFKILRLPFFLPYPVVGLIGLAAILNVLLVGFMGILMTHRVAGPMYSLVRQFRRVEEGRWYGQMRIRDGDDMRYVVRNFNAMMEAINSQAHLDSDKLRNIREVLVSSELTESEKITRALLDLKVLDSKLRARLNAESEPNESDA